MEKDIQAFIDQLKKADTNESAYEIVRQFLEANGQHNLIPRLAALANIDGNAEEVANTFGYYIIPILMEQAIDQKAPEQKTLVSEIQTLAQDRNVPETLSMQCLGMVDKLFRKDGYLSENEFQDFIHTIATDADSPAEVRAKAVRLLTRLPVAQQRQTLSALVDSGQTAAIEAACHTIAWGAKDHPYEYEDLIDKIIAFAERSPAEAINNPNILKTLARSPNQKVTAVIDAVLDYAATDDDWLRLATCVGSGGSAKQLAAIIDAVAAKPGPRPKIAMRNLIRSKPDLMERLHGDKHYAELLHVITTEPDLLGKAAISYLDRLETVEEAAISRTAQAQKQELATARHNAYRAREKVLRWKQKDLADRSDRPPVVPLAQGGAPNPVNAAFSTNFNMGDALYRDTYIIVPFHHNHWHAAVFQTFEFISQGADKTGQMRGVHMTGFPGDVVPFSASQSAFADPGGNVADAMRALRDDFFAAFKVDDEHHFRGARQTPTMTKDDRLALLDISERLVGQNIYYTFADMLDWKGAHWSGAVEDIDNLRCDGVIEYTFEACGKKVCAGTEVSNWNIAAPGNQHPESHADLHTWSLNEGELCPKVQAGDEGHDSTFIPSIPAFPGIDAFEVFAHTPPSGNGVTLKINVKSNEYYQLYVRIVVRPIGGDFDFIVTGPSTAVTPRIQGDWMFKLVDEGTNHFADWQGETRSGQNYSGDDGDYEFRVVAVDMGGNVSEELSVIVPINWGS